MQSDSKIRKILVTTALPYANGSIHLGHMVEYVQCDIWVRYQRMNANRCWFVGADDAHGTPIMLRAQEEKISPEELIGRMKQEHEADITAFSVSFDHYHTTHSPENEKLSTDMFLHLQSQGQVYTDEVEQLYDEQAQMFLPDRYIKGTCPACKTPEQYGDACENCSAAYSAQDLLDSYSVLSGQQPTLKRSKHYFLKITNARNELLQWLEEEVEIANKRKPRLQVQAYNKLLEWLKDEDGLRDWDISRDAPYFGFRIPNEPLEKYFYVWLDAPIGYLASFSHLCEAQGIDFAQYCAAEHENDSEMYHFIGKDILYFHGLFWPFMLKHSGYRRPTQLCVHGFLTVNGQKMSKSKGTFITARQYLDSKLPTDMLRYYYASKLSDRIEDIDLSLPDFCGKVNSDLVNKFANIPSRICKLLSKHFDNRLGADYDEHIVAQIVAVADKIGLDYEERRYSSVVRTIMQKCDVINAYIEENQPWVLAKQCSEADAANSQELQQLQQLHKVLSTSLEGFRLLSIYLKPILPELILQVEKFLNLSAELAWQDIDKKLPADWQFAKYEHLVRRVEMNQVNTLLGKIEE